MKKTKKVKVVDNLMDTIDDFFNGKEKHRKDKTFIELCNRIKGKIIEVIYVNDDAFEVHDNNYWLPNCCFTEIDKKGENKQ